jgi:tetratricopeptide (TPR) repeat protein
VVTKKDKYLAAAQKFLDRGQLDKALAEFARVVQEDPKDTRTWLKMAELHAKRGAADQATEIYLKTGEQYTEQGFFQKAVAVYKNVLKLSPGYLAGHFKLAEVYKRLGLLSDAAQQFELATSALQKTGKPTEVLAALRQLVEVSPDNVAARIRLAEAASQASLTEEAIAGFSKAAEQLRAQGRTEEYIRVAERLLFHQPDNLAVARALAGSYIGKKNARLALAKLQVCLKAQPRDPDTVSLLARAFEQLDVPKAISVWRELAEIHAESGRPVERDDAIAKALALDARDAETLALQRRYGAGGAGISLGWGSVPGLVPLRPPPPDTSGQGHPPPVPFDVGVKRSGGTGASGSPVPPASVPAAGAAVVNPDIARIMAESEVFVKYGLLDRAVDHLRRVFDIQSDYQPARDKLASVLDQLGRKADVAPVRSLEPPPPAPAPPAADPVAVEAPPVASFGSDLEIELEPLEEEDNSGVEAVSGQGNPATTIGSFEENSPATTIGSFEESFEASPATTIGSFEESPATTIGSFEDQAPAPRDAGPATVMLSIDSELVEELEQIDFFIEQSMPEEARQALEDARERFGTYPQIEQRMHQVLRLLGEQQQGAIPRAQAVGGGGADTGVDENHSQPVAMVADGGPADLATHGDLGIAYKEMGLYDPAINEFKLLIRDPARKVFALTMIGECYEARGAFKDAVVHYKEALNNPAATETESTLLYYLLGNTFQQLNDGHEALYYYEKVSRRDPKFRDVEARLAALKPLHVRRA